ncbi:MAG: hypothetical protein H0S79_15875 [Anaerolineaceae bacterium]|nr:hypothetical protein [Anaerolineaceae bacterium]
MKSKSALGLLTAITISSILFLFGNVEASAPLPQEGEPIAEGVFPIDTLPKELELGQEADGRRNNYQSEVVLDRSSAEDRFGGEPDDFGYAWENTEPYNWIDAKVLGSNIGIYGGDNYTSSPIPIGFTFPFYGVDYADVYITTEGLIDFFGPDVWWSNTSIPSLSDPDSFIAPFWTDLGMYNNGNRPEAGIYVYQGGIAPERYLVIEWYRSDVYYSSDFGAEEADLTFEVILHENGDIVMQYQQLEGNYDAPSIGIEDSMGTDGLEYGDNASEGLAIRFNYPEPAYRVQLLSEQTNGFISRGMNYEYDITLINPGELGTDSYSLITDSIWPFELYEMDGLTPVTGLITVDQGESIEFIGRLSVPQEVRIGDSNTVSITATSTNNPEASKTIHNTNAVPAPFAQILYDQADNFSSTYLVSPFTQRTFVNNDNFALNDLAIAELPNRNQIVLGSLYGCLDESCEIVVGMIYYWIIDPEGNMVLPPHTVADHRNATVSTIDHSVSVDVNSNGEIGIAWVRTKYKADFTGHLLQNTDIHYMSLNQNGSLKVPWTNATNDLDWYIYYPESEIGREVHQNPKIAVLDNGYLQIAWEKTTLIKSDPDLWTGDIYLRIHSAGPAANMTRKLANGGFTGESYIDFVDVSMTTIDENRVFIAWKKQVFVEEEGGNQMLMTSSTLESSYYDYYGRLIVLWSTVDNFFSWAPDVTQLTDGTILLAADGNDRVVVQRYDGSNYEPLGEVISLFVPDEEVGEKYISVTPDFDSNGVITWFNREDSKRLSYALISSDGNILTEPMQYYQAGEGSGGQNSVVSGTTGHGITTYTCSFPPEFTSSPTMEGFTGFPYAYIISADDADLPVDTVTIIAPTLPNWLSFTDYGDGTALLSGMPSTLEVGDHNVELVVEDYFGMKDTQFFSITVLASEAPAFTSADNVIFTESVAGSFTIETSGAPDATIALVGSLPTGVSFLDNGDGTATISGMPAKGTGGTSTIVTLNAANGIDPDASQTFTIVVGIPPQFDSGDTASGTATVGEFIQIFETVTGYPGNPEITISGVLPSGMLFSDDGSGTAAIIGTPEVGSGGVYQLTLMADNGTAFTDTLAFTLTVKTIETIGTAGGTISSDGGDIIIEIPSGSLTEEIIFEFIPQIEPTKELPSRHAFAGISFQILASIGEVVVHPTFDPPMVIGIHYDESELGGLAEEKLLLKYWDTETSTWLDAAKTCVGGTGYTYYPDLDFITVEVCHLTEFAVMGEMWMDVFLPLVVR